MGIRVHKILGWGLTDVKCEHAKQPEDPRINNESLTRVWDQSNDEMLSAYLSFLDETQESDFGTLDKWMLSNRSKEDRKLHMSDCIAFDSEYGLPNVLCLRPLACDDWSRFDDTIDYTIETYLSEDPLTNRVEILQHPPYPYNALYMDKRTGVRVPNEIMWWIRHRSAGKESDELAKLGGFNSHAEADENIAPIVPQEIRDLSQFLGLFTSDDVWMQLRPMLYTYWS